MRLLDFGSRARGRRSAERRTCFFWEDECLKHEGNNERAGLARRGDGTTARSIGAGVD